jgi:anti-anti-sigma regulatory factor
LESAVRFTAVWFANEKGTPPAKRAKRTQPDEIALLTAGSAKQGVSPKVFRFVTVAAGLFCCVRSRLATTHRLFNTLTFGTPHALQTAMNSDIVLAVRASHLEGNALTTLKEDLRFLAQPGRNLSLDLSAVEAVTAAAAKVIVDANARLQPRGGSLQLIGVRNTVAAYFELLRVHRQLPINPASPIALPLAA